jgi:predicted ATPase with chaperone activity
VLPTESAQAAALVGGLDIRAADSLLQVVQSLQPGDDPPTLPRAQALPAGPAPAAPELRDVKGRPRPSGRWRSPPPARTACC